MKLALAATFWSKIDFHKVDVRQLEPSNKIDQENPYPWPKAKVSTFFALCGRTLPLWTLTLPNFGFFMFSGFSDIASSNEIKRKSTFTNNRPYTWAAEITSKIEKKPIFKNTRKKACDFYEQGFLLGWFSTRNKESPSCRKMFGESYVAPTRRSQKFLPKIFSKLKDQQSVAGATGTHALQMLKNR